MTVETFSNLYLLLFFPFFFFLFCLLCRAATVAGAAIATDDRGRGRHAIAAACPDAERNAYCCL